MHIHQINIFQRTIFDYVDTFKTHWAPRGWQCVAQKGMNEACINITLTLTCYFSRKNKYKYMNLHFVFYRVAPHDRATQIFRTVEAAILKYREVSNIRRTSVGNTIVNHSDVVGAWPVGAAPTTSSFSTYHLASLEWAKATAWRGEEQLSFMIRCLLY